MASAQDIAESEGQTTCLGSARDEGQGRAPRSGSEARDPCVHSHVREGVCTMRHMDDFAIVGPLDKAMELTEEMGHTMLLRDVQFLELGKRPVKFLGWMLERTVDGFRLMINPPRS